MSEEAEISSAPGTPRAARTNPPTNRYNSPSLSRAPLLATVQVEASRAEAPPSKPSKSTPRLSSPVDSPTRRALDITKFDPQDDWLPITESRNGNAFYAVFHVLCSVIAVQALILPVAFTILGWAWGMITLILIFMWQLYTIWLLVQLHESRETGMRYSRYLHLCCATFGNKLGKLLALFPIMYLSGGTCVALIILGGSTLKTFVRIVCTDTCNVDPLTPVQWFLVFSSAALLLSLLPNLNSIAGVSLVGAITAIGYCTLIWVVSAEKGRLPGVSYDPLKASTDSARFFDTLDALGMVAFAFRGHNLILEIQATMPSSEKRPSRVPMWRAVKFAYLLIAVCIFPLAIAGFWAYGTMIPPIGGLLTAMYAFHSRDVSRSVIGLMSLLIIIHAVTSFQIYGMQMYDIMEAGYTSRMKKPLTWWLRVLSRFMIVYGCFFVAVAIPFLGSLDGLIGGIALPVTLAYPCFMWVKIKKPKMYSGMWWLNWGLGVLGMCLSGLLIVAGIYTVINADITWDFFHPK